MESSPPRTAAPSRVVSIAERPAAAIDATVMGPPLAVRMPRDGDGSLAEVPLEAGFSSQSHFTGRFREIVGSTPLRHRSERGALDVPHRRR